MAEQDSTVEDPTELMTTSAVETTQQTATGSSVMSSTSRGVDFYFQCAVVAIGVVGTAANALVLYAMVATGQHKKHVLIFNQNALDFASCFFLVITYVVKLCNIRLTGRSGYWLCVIVLSENFLWSPISGSTINLTAITIERYVKVVHSTWSKNNLRNWMIYSASAFAWIGGTVVTFGMTIPTSGVIDGICYSGILWESKEAQLACGISSFLFFEVAILAIMIFCYWRMLVVIRRQAKVMAGHHGAGPSTSQARQSSKIQSNIVKTMSIVSVFFAISWSPLNVLNFIMIIDAKITFFGISYLYYAAVFIIVFYICANPFIYVTKFDPVKRILLGLIPCKNSVQPVTSIEITPKQT